ncbi:hypothetical protein CC80DRAFT_247218 [Byssothecium circinans]|uniref:Uncharacterized protein n=1 Tax=Byssothecium circinans TaxID=147558 RepID=A0A6A5TAN5_9PLEO|nr:hypothetical protein CC80DRAFT_247218 [Byssothecium circinans]
MRGHRRHVTESLKDKVYSILPPVVVLCTEKKNRHRIDFPAEYEPHFTSLMDPDAEKRKNIGRFRPCKHLQTAASLVHASHAGMCKNEGLRVVGWSMRTMPSDRGLFNLKSCSFADRGSAENMRKPGFIRFLFHESDREPDTAKIRKVAVQGRALETTMHWCLCEVNLFQWVRVAVQIGWMEEKRRWIRLHGR